MIEQWSEEFSASVREWCNKVSRLGVDVLIDAGLVAKADFERAAAIVAEELLARLSLNDYPPIAGHEGKPFD